MALVGNPQVHVPTVLMVPGRESTEALYGPWPRAGDYWDALVVAAVGRVVVLSWRGEESVARFLFESSRPFDFIYNRDQTLGIDSSAVLVPESLVKTYYQESLDDLSALLRRLTEVSPRAIAVVSSPPPKRSDLIKVGISAEKDYTRILRDLGKSLDDVQITSDTVRLKLWRLQQDGILKTVHDNGGIYIGVPPGSMDGSGFLRDEFSARDVTHANGKYGGLAFEEIERALQGLRDHHGGTPV